MPEETPKPNGNIWSIVVLLFTFVGGLSAVWSGLNLELDHMTKQIESFKEELNRRLIHIETHVDETGHPKTTKQALDALRDRLSSHESIAGHPVVEAQLSAIMVKFTEVETQFKKETGARDLRFRAEDEKSEGRDKVQEEKIKALLHRIEKLEGGS